MLKIEKGGVYTAARLRNGESDKGPWEIIAVKEDGKAHREVSIFAANAPSGTVEGGTFSVDEILSASPKRSKDKAGNWKPGDKTFLECRITPLTTGQELDDMLGSDGDDIFL